MTEFIDAEELAVIEDNFEAILGTMTDPVGAYHLLYDLGWPELLSSSPFQVAAVAFEAMGVTGSAVTLLDDVVAHSLGLPLSLSTCVIFPAILHTNPAAPQWDQPLAPGEGDLMALNGLVSSRVEQADTAIMFSESPFGPQVASIDAALLRESAMAGVDPAGAYRHVSTRLSDSDLTLLETEGTWDDASTAARIALAHQLVGGARQMLAEACQHAMDREQFGRPIASFQAVRHKLAESVVQIEGAASVANSCLYDPNQVLAGAAKALAGKAALTTAAHAQQVLAGMGFTAEHPFHLLLKRTLVLDVLFGSYSSLATDIGRDWLLLGTVPRLIYL